MSITKKRAVLVHHHIFKNAGTSFNYALKQAFKNGFCEYDLPNSQVVTSQNLATYIQKNPDSTAISGHHICLPTPQGKSYTTISSVIIRHPLARVRSIYEFERTQDAETEGAKMAKKLSFKDFVAWRLDTSAHVFGNYQTLYCSRKSNLKPQYKLTAEDLSSALMNLNNCFVVGTVERYKEFLMMAQCRLKTFFPEVVLQNSHLNVTKGKPASSNGSGIRESLYNELGSDIASELEKRNKLDECLYLHANLQLDRWIAISNAEKSEYAESAS